MLILVEVVFDIRWCTILIAIDLSCSLILSRTLEFLDIALCTGDLSSIYASNSKGAAMIESSTYCRLVH